MLWWIIPVGVVMLLLLYLLFAWFYIEIDSPAGLAGIRFGGIAEASIILNETIQVVRIKIAWWKKEYDLSDAESGGAVKRREVNASGGRIVRKPKRKRIPVQKLLRKLKGIIQSFKINKCNISVDTGDMPLNAILYPWFYLVKWRTGKNVSINFVGENVIILQAKNSIARMLWAYIKS